MRYISTRSDGLNRKGGMTASQAIIQGISQDKGLFVPDSMPRPLGDVTQLTGKTYNEVACLVLSRFLTDFTEEALMDCVQMAYDEKFESKDIVPIVQAGDAFFMELFHGPTAAFKDMALSILPHFLTKSLQKQETQNQIAILTATSGDTGKAALEGFANVEKTKIIVFYPCDGVSLVQERQMTTQVGDNVHVFGIQGNFDDAQTAVKKIFSDHSLGERINGSGWQLSSANSINIGRLVPQVVYYVWSYVQLLERNVLQPGDKMNVVVPTGNFGNILSAYYAREMGIPVGKFICASNQNHVLTDFINTGVYDTRREFHLTSSPSMDILVSSNLERLLYHLSGEKGQVVSAYMQSLEENQRYVVSDNIRVGLTEFFGGFATEEATLESIHHMYHTHQYLMDPHTAVGYKVYDDYVKQTGDKTPTVIAATASAYKFPETVLKALGFPAQKDGFKAIGALHDLTGVGVPKGLQNLDKKPVLHQDSLAIDAIADAVIKALT